MKGIIIYAIIIHIHISINLYYNGTISIVINRLRQMVYLHDYIASSNDNYHLGMDTIAEVSNEKRLSEYKTETWLVRKSLGD